MHRTTHRSPFRCAPAILFAAVLLLAGACASTETPERPQGARAYPGAAPEVGPDNAGGVDVEVGDDESDDYNEGEASRSGDEEEGAGDEEGTGEGREGTDEGDGEPPASRTSLPGPLPFASVQHASAESTPQGAQHDEMQHGEMQHDEMQHGEMHRRMHGDADPPTPEEAIAFVDEAEARLLDLVIHAERAAWVQANFITHDTELLAARAAEELLAENVRYAQTASRYDGVDVPPEVRRKLELLKTSLTLPAPAEAEKTAELTRITTRLESLYGTGKYCPEEGGCQDLGELSDVIATSRDPQELLEAWVGWRTVSPPMADDYARMVELANEGARALGYADVGALWRAKYDMPPDAFAAELDRLFEQVRPLYEALHCHVRAELQEQYGKELVPDGEPIPAHLLGNMWAQSWGNVYELVAPQDADPGYDLTSLLQEKGLDAREMVRYGERFFSSLGFAPLPETFWERSLFTKPADREVVCHASAWDVDQVDDLRIKMCIEVNAEDFQVIHHELGHNYYQRAYNQQPFFFRNSANDGFHEAIGDAVALSVTPAYLVDLGFLEEEPPADKDLGLLLRDALDKVAFLPFGLLVDQWRWQVFSGEIPPEEYNAGWWRLREKYQGVAPPVERTGEHFDPGAKYHIPGNTPYTRYFLAGILQFQFHRSLCEAAGYEGPLNRCTIYGSEEAGRRLDEMLRLGQSRPWPDALEAMTGERTMDATAILDYFAPLQAWLDEQNAGRQCGW